jgi:hypothetical protein
MRRRTPGVGISRSTLSSAFPRATAMLRVCAPGVKRAYAIIVDRVEGASGGAAASAHLSTARHGEADGERSFRFGSRIRRLLAAYRHPAGHEAEAIKAVDGDRRRADRARRGPHICIPPRYSRLVGAATPREAPITPPALRCHDAVSLAACSQLVNRRSRPRASIRVVSLGRPQLS